MTYPEIKQIAQKLRNNPTPEEKFLWRNLRKRKLQGRKFLRQHAIIYESVGREHFFYVPDFYCAAERLIVELDGRIHDYQKERDQHRDEILTGMNLRILRIKNEELNDMLSVLKRIEDMFIF